MNIIFEKKHYYFNLLTNTFKLKGLELTDSKELRDTEKRNINRLYNSAFIGLLMEGIPCVRKKNAEGIILEISLDNEYYGCQESVLKRILKDSYDRIVTIEQDEVESKQDKTDEKPKEEAISNKEDVVDKVVVIEEVPAYDAVEEKKEITEIPVVYKTVPKEEVIPEPEQHTKMKKELIFDYYNLKLRNVDTAFIDEVDLIVVPINTPLGKKKESSAEIIVYSKDAGVSRTFVSEIEGRKSLTVNTGTHEFIVRGTWENGNFKSYVYPTGLTLQLKYEVIKDVTNIRPEYLDKRNSGHVIFYTNNSDKISVCPLDVRNDTDDLAHIILCYENKDRTERKIYVTDSNTKILTVDNSNEILQVYGYWEDDKFVCDKSINSNG